MLLIWGALGFAGCDGPVMTRPSDDVPADVDGDAGFGADACETWSGHLLPEPE